MGHPGVDEASRRIAGLLKPDELDLSGLVLSDDDVLMIAGTDWLGDLTVLHLSSNELVEVPEWIRNLTALTTLNLADNRLVEVPEWIGNLTALTTLNLAGNRLVEVPEWIGNLTALTTLNLAGNRLVEVPEAVGDLTALTTLDLNGNDLTALPKWIENLTALSILGLRRKTLPQTIEEMTAFPKTMGKLTALTSLHLAGHYLGAVPEWIGNLTALTTLDLSFNKLVEVPAAMGNLTALTTLDLSFNHLVALPEAVGNLTALTTLDLSGSQLVALPEVVGNLTALTTLDLARNQLVEFPEVVGNLTALTFLDLSGNQLVALPEAVGNLTALTTLDLASNRLVALPEAVGNLTALTTLNLAGNHLPPEIEAALFQGTDELLTLLRLIHSDGVELAEAKLVLVGEGAVGKSSLLASLRGEPWNSAREQTHGLQVKAVQVESGDGPITLNGWDFGGQRVYRPTHQLFFTAPAVYLVTWKPREGPEVGLVEQWLAMIQHRAGPGARVHVVATHGGPTSRASALDETRLKERFGQLIVAFHNIDSKIPQTLTGLKAAVSETARELPHVRRRYPASWIRVRNALAGSGEQSLPYEGYLKIAADQDLTPTAARSLAVNSHALGHWIHYADEPALAQVVVIKPDWLSVAVAAVLEDPQAGRQGGVITHRRLGQIWSTPSADGTRPAYDHLQQQMFLRMMERFELTYRVPELVSGEPLSLVGQLVPADRPDLSVAWEMYRPGGPEAVEICQVIETGTDRLVAPEGLVYRLIVRLHRQSLDPIEAPDGAHWRGGLVIQSRYSARALITLTPDGIRVHVRGPDPHTFLRQVSDEVRECVEGFWQGLTTRALMPCNEPCGLNTPGRGLFDLDKLIAAREDGRVDFPCSATGCRKYPTIDSLLGATGGAPGGTDQWAATAQGVVDILAQLDTMSTTQSHQNRAILTSLDAMNDGLKADLARNDAALSRIMRSLDDEAADGPRLFSLVPVNATVLKPGWIKHRMRLTLYCEHSRWPVHVLDPTHPGSGIYELEIPREWWVKAVPLLKMTSMLIKPFLSIGLAVTELDFSTTEWDAVKEQLALGKEALNAAADLAGETEATDEWDADPDAFAALVEAEGGVLRTLHVMLREQDPTFADLRRVSDAAGRYRWVHRRFVPVYQPPLPDIPTEQP